MKAKAKRYNKEYHNAKSNLVKRILRRQAQLITLNQNMDDSIQAINDKQEKLILDIYNSQTELAKLDKSNYAKS